MFESFRWFQYLSVVNYQRQEQQVSSAKELMLSCRRAPCQLDRRPVVF